MIKFDLGVYVKEVLFKIIPVIIIAPIIPLWVFFTVEQNLFTFVSVCLISVFSVSISIYLLGLSKAERNFINKKVLSFIK